MLFLGVDFGTSAVKAMVIDGQGKIQAQVYHPLPKPLQVSFPDGIGYEQEPDIWWDGFINLLHLLKKQIHLENIKAIAIDGTSGTVLPCNASGTPLAKALMYNDSRANAEHQIIFNLCQKKNIKLGNVSGLARILWLLNQPFAKEIVHFVNQADWIVGKLTGQFNHSDNNNVLKMAYDVVNNRWPKWLYELNLDFQTLPQVHKPGKDIACIEQSIIRLGFSGDTRVVAGTTDSTAAIMASGAARVGEAITSLGSTMVMKVISDFPINDEKNGIYSQPFGDNWLVGGSSNSGGAVLKYFFTQSQIEHYSKQLIPERPTGFDYYPLIERGERFPFADADKLPELEPRPDSEVLFFQALLEGMANIEYLAYKKLNELGAPYPKSVVTMGGGAKNFGWSKIRAAQLQVPLKNAAIEQAAYGTAKLALSGYKNR